MSWPLLMLVAIGARYACAEKPEQKALDYLVTQRHRFHEGKAGGPARGPLHGVPPAAHLRRTVCWPSPLLPSLS